MTYVPRPITNGSQLLTFRSALAKTLAGTARTKILFVGDSTTEGQMTGGTNLTRMPERFATMLTAAGYTAHSNTRMGPAVVTDAAVSIGAWVAGGAAGIFGGGGYQLVSAAGGSTLSFTPPNSFDRITVQHITLSGHGTVVMNVDGGATLQTYNANGATALTTVTTNVTPGTHTINFVGSSGGSFYLRSIEAWSSTTPAVSIFNAGRSGSSVGSVSSSQVYSDYQLIDAIDPDLTVISYTINDSNGATALSSYTASLKALADRAALSGNVLIVGGMGSSPEPVNHAAYLAACQSIGYPCILTSDRWGNHAMANAAGMMSDSLHPSAAGYADWARFIFRALEI